MKQIPLSILAILVSVAAFCQSENLDDVRKLLQVTTYVTVPEDVKALFGKPTDVYRGDKVIIWTYTNKERGIKFYWDLRVIKLQEFYFTTAPNDQKSSMNGTCKLEMGVTELADMIMMYGNPRNLHANRNNQMAHYEFENTNINLRFHNGKLINYEVNYLDTRKDRS